MASPIRIAVLANAAQAKREIDSVEARGQKMSKGLKIAGRVAAAGLLIVAAAGLKAGQAAAADEAAQSKLAQTSRTAAKATDAQIKAQDRFVTAAGKAYGVTDDELRPALGKLVTATGDMTKAQRLASIAMDVSTGSGKKLDAVSAALAKAQATGNVAALAKFGVATKDAHGKTLSLAAVTQKLADKYKGAASKAAETTAGKQKILTVQMGELQEQIGAKLLPVMNKLATAGIQAVEWMSQNEGKAKALAITIGAIAAAVLAANVAMKVYNAGMVLYNGTTAVFKAAQTAATVAQIAFNVAMAANPVGVIVLGVIALVGALVLAYKKSDKFREIVNAAFSKVQSAAAAVLGFVKKNWPYLLGILLGPFGLAAVTIAKHWTTIQNGATTVKNWIITKFTEAKNKLVTIAGQIKDAVLAPFQAIADAVQHILDLIGRIKIPKISLPKLGRVAGPGNTGSTSTTLANPSAINSTAITTYNTTVETRNYTINVSVGLGASLVETGRAIVEAITAYEDVAGRRLTA